MSRYVVVVSMLGMMVVSGGPAVEADGPIELVPVGRLTTGLFDRAVFEIAAYDPGTKRIFGTNVEQSRIDIVDITRPDTPISAGVINLSSYGRHANSVAVKNGVVAAAVEAVNKTDPGKVVFFTPAGEFLSAVPAGAVPDMLTFTPDGKFLLVANEAEPNDAYTVDPEGGVTIVDMSKGAARLTDADATFVRFTDFNGTTLDPSVRIFGRDATVAQDLEPEYIAVGDDSRTAWVTLQENNAIAILDIREKKFTKIVGLGFKDHSAEGYGLDASDQDNAINIANWPLFGMYLPDTIGAFQIRGRTFLATANEGDVREWPGINSAGTEARRAGTLTLDPTAFPNRSALQANTALGRLNVTIYNGDTDRDGDFDALYSFGGRSVSIWSDAGKLVWDSGNFLERLTAEQYPQFFNASSTNNTRDNRSDDKGPEPEGLAVAGLFGRTYIFVSLERVGGIVVFEVGPTGQPSFVQYVNVRNFTVAPETAAAGDLGTEGLVVVSAADSPNGEPLLIAANEVSGSLTVYQIRKK